MVTPEQIEEWVQEVEQRPTSAPLIIQYISRRLRDLTARNEDLLAENIELRTGRKVDEYESRIANLEYQLDLLKRQFGGDALAAMPAQALETISLLVYTVKGEVIRAELPVSELASGKLAAGFRGALAPGGIPPRLLVTNPQEELLFVFDSGRTVTRPVSDIPTVETGELDWRQAHLVEPRGTEELAVIIPIARMTLFDTCIQTSRRGYVKRMMKNAFESHLAKGFIGTGVKLKADKTCSLALCGKDDRLVLATREGYLLTMEIGQLPYAAEEIIKLSATDYVVSGFSAGKKNFILALTQNGKAIHREAGWLETAESFKSRGQALFSQSRREAGARLVGAASVDEADWAMLLFQDGSLAVAKMADVFASGAVAASGVGQKEVGLVDFATFTFTNGNKD